MPSTAERPVCEWYLFFFFFFFESEFFLNLEEASKRRCLPSTYFFSTSPPLPEEPGPVDDAELDLLLVGVLQVLQGALVDEGDPVVLFFFFF